MGFLQFLAYLSIGALIARYHFTLTIKYYSYIGEPHNEEDVGFFSALFVVPFWPVILVRMVYLLDKFVVVKCENCKAKTLVPKYFAIKEASALQDNSKILKGRCRSCSANLTLPIRKHKFFLKVIRAAAYDKFVKEHVEEVSKLTKEQ